MKLQNVLLTLGLIVVCTRDGWAETLKDQLGPIQLGHIRQVHLWRDVYLAGQPTEQDLPTLQADGLRTVINLRRADEVSWDEAAAVARAGMKYVHVPFHGEDELTPEVFDRVLAVLRDKRRGPTLLHCASANRVGALWYAYRVLDHQVDAAQAEREAHQVGLRTAGYLQKAKDYVAARRNQIRTAPAASE